MSRVPGIMYLTYYVQIYFERSREHRLHQPPHEVVNDVAPQNLLLSSHTSKGLEHVRVPPQCKVTRVRHRYPFVDLPIEQVLVVTHLCWLRRDRK